MLVLRRKAGEAVVLNTVIRIVILSIEKHVVKIGIDAPPDVIILRDELLHDEGMMHCEANDTEDHGE